ncbi:MAG TPA: hypothetical protein VMV94_01610 [Phycisphaerae bacterium]|nr:hypothetical protein [Phycisphaerae bacterium]
MLAAAGLNLVEFFYWLGMPLALLFFFAAASAVRAVVRRRASAVELFTVAAAVLLPLLAVFSGSIGEVARLWIFLIPVLTLAGAAELDRLAGPRPQVLLQMVMICQFAWMCLLKARQDFW